MDGGTHTDVSPVMDIGDCLIDEKCPHASLFPVCRNLGLLL